MGWDGRVGAALEHGWTADSIKHWVAAFLHYLELRLQLLGLECKEAGLHLLVIGLLVTPVLGIFCGFLVIFAVFLLFLIITLLHFVWGWGGLFCSGGFFFGCVGAGNIFCY